MTQNHCDRGLTTAAQKGCSGWPIIAENYDERQMIVVAAPKLSFSQKSNPLRISFPIVAQKISPHTYVIWLASLSAFRLGSWDGADYLIFC
jgi:hypothetical protein